MDRPDPITVEGKGKGYPIRVGFDSNYSLCKKCEMPVYWYRTRFRNPISLDPRFVVKEEQDKVGGWDGIKRPWIWCLPHGPLCEGQPDVED